jgi:hypothetical protein
MRRRVGAIVGMCAIVLTGAGAAVAQTSEEATAPVAFSDSAALEISCADLAKKEGVSVQLQNETAAPQTVQVRLQLRDENGRPVGEESICGKLTQNLEAAKLAAGQTTTLKLTAEEESDARKISGSLVIHVGRGRVSRREVTIAPPATAHELKEVPLVSSVSATFEGLGGQTIWVPVKEKPAADEEGTKAQTVGALAGPDNPVSVVYKGTFKALGGEAWKVALEFQGDLEPGTYSGQVDLAPDDDEEGVVELEVKASQTVVLALVLLVVGILLGLGLLRFGGRDLPATRLRARVAGLGKRHVDAVQTLAREADDASAWTGFEIKDLDARIDALEGQIDEAQSKVAIKLEKSAVDGIEAAIALLEGQIDMLKEIPRHARRVEAALRLPKAGHLPGGDPGPPKLEGLAAAAIKGEALSPGDVKPRIEEIGTMAKLAGDLRRHEAFLERLWEGVGGDESAKSLRRRLENCRNLLWDAEDADGLKIVSEELQQGWEELVRWSGSEAGSTEAGQQIERGLTAETAMSSGKAQELIGEVAAASQAPVPSPLALATPPATPLSLPQLPPAPRRLDSKKAEEAVRKARRLQLGVVVLAVLVALLTGLETLYFGKTWGETFWDYPLALTWGFGATAVTGTLATSLDDLVSLGWLRRRI